MCSALIRDDRCGSVAQISVAPDGASIFFSFIKPRAAPSACPGLFSVVPSGLAMSRLKTFDHFDAELFATAEFISAIKRGIALLHF